VAPRHPDDSYDAGVTRDASSTAAQAPTIPHGDTAQRPDWLELPEDLRERIEARLGGRVTAVASQRSGFTSGFAARLLVEGGGSHFVKASATFADAYRAEARIVPRLPDGVPTPALRWALEHGDWVVLCFDDIPGHPPTRPWRPDELTKVLTTLTPMAEALTPAPPQLVVPEARDWMREDFGYWRRLVDAGGGSTAAAADHKNADDHAVDRHLTELAELDDLALEALHGDAVVHCDLRDDNVIMADDGTVWICDWNWPSRAAPWLDLLTILISAHGDGYDATALFTAHPLGADVDPEAVDAALAGLGGYFTRASQLPTVEDSPFLRTHHAWYAQACLSWLAVRRGWVG